MMSEHPGTVPVARPSAVTAVREQTSSHRRLLQEPRITSTSSMEGSVVSGRYSVECSRCAYARTIGVPPRQYVFPDGTSMPIQDAFGWCEACLNVTPCENLPEQADVERLLLAARREANKGLMAELERTSTWLVARVSPARCLECGNSRIRQFPLGWSVYREDASDEDFLDIPHPGCDGMLHVQLTAWSLYRDWTSYSPEGERMAAPFSASD